MIQSHFSDGLKLPPPRKPVLRFGSLMLKIIDPPSDVVAERHLPSARKWLKKSGCFFNDMVEVALDVSICFATHVYLCYMLSTSISEVGEGYGTKRII